MYKRTCLDAIRLNILNVYDLFLSPNFQLLMSGFLIFFKHGNSNSTSRLLIPLTHCIKMF